MGRSVWSISLDEECSKIAKHLMKDTGNLSELIKNLLVQHAKEHEDPNYLAEQLKRAYEQREEAELKVNQLRRKIDEINEKAIAKTQIIKKGKDSKELLKDEENILRTCIMNLEVYFGLVIKDPTDPLIMSLFNLKKHNPSEHPQVLLIRFAQENNLKFKKEFPFLKRPSHAMIEEEEIQ